MRTQLSHFCEQFVKAVHPVFDPLDRALAALEQETDGDTPGSGLRAGLADTRNQLHLLQQKVEEQRAYVLIFGPLKSGKSTLMNSIAGSYVSEVSSLPAYPSLVFVSHGDQQEFVVTDYEGDHETFKETDKLAARIDSAHEELARNIRDAEESGEVFDPQEHFPQAIHRIDVRVEAQNLEESGAVLVDTPGLYTRMRFGYDRMTRDFRNAAACAIFVVKSDTLFLEQVFAEFNQLLDLFSRIFLVINMDTTKRDVDQDGKLVPSMEQRDPARIVEAFEHLAMPKPLKVATEAGRLCIFPVDLMRAASAALTGADAPEDFRAFRGDLEEYLASTDYLMAFLSDSLKRARHLIAEASELSEGPFTQQLRTDRHDADSQREALEEELRLLNDCMKLDWGPAFRRHDDELAKALSRTSQDVGARIARDMSAAIETWILSTHSLQWLLDTVWKPLFKEYVQSMRDTAERCFEKSIYQDHGGLDFDADLAHFLGALEIDFRELRQRAYADLANQTIGMPQIPLDVEDIPVRRGFLDVVTFRNEDKVREKLFGHDLDARIPAKLKASRLGEPAKRYLNQFLLNFREEFFPETIAKTQQRYGDGLAKVTVQKLHEVLGTRRPKLQARVDELQQRIAQIGEILTPVEDLSQRTEKIQTEVEALDARFAQTDAAKILEPMPRKGDKKRGKRKRGQRT